MEDSKLQQLHDTLAKIRGTGKQGLGRHGGIRGHTKNNKSSVNALYAHFVPEGTYQPDAHIKRDFSSDEEETKEVAVHLDSKADRKAAKKAAKKLAKKEEKKRKKQEAKQRAKNEAKRLAKKSDIVAESEPSSSSRKEKKVAKKRKRDNDNIHQAPGESSGPSVNDENQKSKKAKKKKKGDKAK